MPKINFCFLLPRRLLFVICLTLGACAIVHAHDPGLSAADVKFTSEGFVVALSFADIDIEPLCTIDSDQNGKISLAEFAAAKAKLELLARSAFQVRSEQQQLQAAKVIQTYDPESNTVHCNLTFALAVGSRLVMRSAILESLPRGHRQYLSLRDERGTILAEQMLKADSDQFVLDSSVLKKHSASFGRFVRLGTEHILTGYDHLAFLLVLLLAGSKLRETGKLITSFTLAHSLTLALATLDLVRVPSSVVEPLIAVSIVYVGLENLFRRDFKRRWLLTFAFGLIHGLGFASVLRELGIGTRLGEVIIPLLSFNLGVEFGQFAIAALILPVIWKLRRHPAFVVKYVPACSVAVVVLGGYWLLERAIL